MKRSLARIMTACFLLFPLASLQTSCSSSETATGEEVAANGEEGNAANPDEAGNNTNNDAAEGNAAEGNSAEGNAAEGNNENNALANNTENNQGADLNQGADTNNVVADNAGAQGGEQDLQQIIEEMNGANTQLANQAPAQGEGQNFDNIGGQAPADNAAPLAEQGATENISTTPSFPPAAAAPSGIAAGPGLPELGSKMVYFVQKGDTLAKIAQRIYGDGNKWTEIANFTGLANPKLIYPGDVVYYQLNETTMNFASAYEGMKRNEVQVSQGDTLATIASRVLGNSALWKLIWRQNDRIDNPDRLTAGTTIYYVDPASVASIDVTSNRKMVDATKKINGTKIAKTSKAKEVKNNVYEVANDNFEDMFTGVSKDLTKRSLI